MLKKIKKNISQTKALVIKDLKLRSRYLVKFLLLIVIPFTNFILPLLVFNKIFDEIGEESFGIWTPENYIIFILTGVMIVIVLDLISLYGNSFLREKYWKTLPGLFMSPVNTYNILLSKLVAELIAFLIPLSLVFIICFLIVKASILTILFTLIFYLAACLFIASVGLAIGSFRLSTEGQFKLFFFFIKFFLIFSCYKYPVQFFPEELQVFVYFNPFYYFWESIRVILILGFENVIFNSRYTIYFAIVIILTIIGPILSVLLFKFVYKKYGITGY
ncbi:MAG: ABC transporter permease [Promethearchaeota archaeon]